ncbi:MAG: bifunctional [glutamine synthetase] adenylyltransferase/[glutamine synthetase]-adenylyl-L-tyrosine phosphorylase [Pseudomonadota bacterium]
MFNLLALSDQPVEAVALAAAHSPYLGKLQTLTDGLSVPEAVLEQAMALCASVMAGEGDPFADLRRAKALAHVAIAASDLSGRASLSQTTQSITEFADAAVKAALSAALRERELAPDGLFVFALGKMGAFELNYSSDIDVSVFFDPDRFEGGDYEAADAAARVIRRMTSILQDRTRDGYVFRTDLRLRPDPSSTPVAVSTKRAELYYDSVGQNWERMVWIKGRCAAGEEVAANAFLKTMQPFVWRRHLDYWAIADVHAIKNMINVKAGDKSLHDVAADLKLGPGGIREIEFFVQTQQIILGGRHPDLRVRGTLEGLRALVDLGSVSEETAADLSQAYTALRMVEHRIQMVDDAQTHTLPALENKRASVAALCGYSDLDRFDADLIAVRKSVHSHYRDLFADETRKRESAVDGNLVFTGVDDDPETLQTLSDLGFSAPAQVIDRIRQWHRGRTPATRTTRGRELLTAFLPDLLAAMAQTGEADEAFRQFGRFFEGLKSGVQLLSMLVAEERLTDDLVTTLAIAPRLANTLARRPALLEMLVSNVGRSAAPKLPYDTDFEMTLDLVRRWHGEQAFLIGHQLLHGQLAARDAAKDWSDLADTCVQVMADTAAKETERRFGPAPGVWSVVGLGKLGGREMTAESDLDIIVIYNDQGASDAQTWFTKFTQRLIAALSAETAEGRLYETDMRLRPSGRSGPVASSVSSFETYHQSSAWTWEHMALTRLRPIAGDATLSQEIEAIAQTAIHTGDPDARTVDVLDMRKRLVRDKPANGPWDLKMRQGGLIDLEFITQHAILTAPLPQTLKPHLPQAQKQLFETGIWSLEDYETLKSAFRFIQSLQQVQRMAHEDVVSQTELSNALKNRLCRATDCDGFDALCERLELVCATVADIFGKKIGNMATES